MISINLLAWALGGPEVAAIVVLAILLFGAKKLPELARALGQAKKEFGKATREAEEEIEKIKEIPPATPPKTNDTSKKT